MQAALTSELFSPVTSTTLTAGQKLAGCYALKKELPAIGRTTVWLAHDDVLGKDVTLHFMPAAIAKDQRALAELRQEVKRNRQLIHPNILRVYDLVEDHGWAAIVMDKPEGESLAGLLQKKGAFTAEEIKPWILELTETLGDAHRIQLFHRDLSPANLLVRANGKVLVTNFGLSRVMADALERGGQANGETTSAACLSPQQLGGERAGASDDIYGLGVLMFELLTGRMPFTGTDLISQIQKTPAPSVGETQKASGKTAPGAPWEELVAQCLAKSPEQRPKTCAEIMAALSQTPGKPAESPAPAPTPAPAKTTISAPAVEKSRPQPASHERKPAAMPAEESPSKRPMHSPPQTSAPPATPGAKPKAPPLPASYPDMDRPRSKAPIIGLGIAAVALGVAIYFAKIRNPDGKTGDAGAVSRVEGTSPKEGAAVNPPAEAVPANPNPGKAAGESAPKPPDGIIAAGPDDANAALEPGEPVPIPVAPQALPKLSIPANASRAQLEQLLEERHIVTDSIRETALTAEAAQQENLRRREVRQTEYDKQKKQFDERRKVLVPDIARATSAETELGKLEDAKNKAQAAAIETAKAAEAAKKSYDEQAAKIGSLQEARKKAETELEGGNQELTESAKQVEKFSLAVTQSESVRQQTALVQSQIEKEIQQINAAREKVLVAEMNALREANREKVAALDARIKDLNAQNARYKTTRDSLVALNDDSMKAAVQTLDDKMAAAKAQIGELQDEKKQLNEVINSKTLPVSLPPAKPRTNPVPPAAETAPGVRANSLGMSFVPVGDVQFCTNLTTRKDFEVFSKAVSLKPERWRNPGFEQTPEHPVVNVTWKEAEAFCKWLTEKERKAGGLQPNEYYRLPTDLEWSVGVGLPAESGATPEDRDLRIEGIYPWGTQWPPPAGAGNYGGEETLTELPIEGYNDKYPNTSPVGAFKANALGLYDMGGNVWQWVQDSFSGSGNVKTLRGGSWYNGSIKASLLSSCRIKSPSDTISDNYGFRIVKAADGKAKK